MPSKLALPDSPRTAVFRLIEKTLRKDPTLHRVLSKDSQWKTWDGSPANKLPFGKTPSPTIRLTPAAGADEWYSPSAIFEPLIVHVELEVEGLNVDDMANLWWAIVRALYPPNPLALSPSPAQAFMNALQGAGASTGMIDFTQPAFARVEEDEGGDDGRLYAHAQLKVELNLGINP